MKCSGHSTVYCDICKHNSYSVELRSNKYGWSLSNSALYHGRAKGWVLLEKANPPIVNEEHDYFWAVCPSCRLTCALVSTDANIGRTFTQQDLYDLYNEGEALAEEFYHLAMAKVRSERARHENSLSRNPTLQESKGVPDGTLNDL